MGWYFKAHSFYMVHAILTATLLFYVFQFNTLYVSLGSLNWSNHEGHNIINRMTKRYMWGIQGRSREYKHIQES